MIAVLFTFCLLLITLLWKWAFDKTLKEAIYWFLMWYLLIFGIWFIKWFMFWKGVQ